MFMNFHFINVNNVKFYCYVILQWIKYFIKNIRKYNTTDIQIYQQQINIKLILKQLVYFVLESRESMIRFLCSIM